MPELDTLRGAAVLLVLLFHGFYFIAGAARFHGPVRWFLLLTNVGWTGVNLFFVLSGFLITGILLDSQSHPEYYRNFYLRRALRILPAYYAVLLLVLAVGRTDLTTRHVSWGFFGLSLVYLSNVTMLLGVPMQYAVLWSLAVEEHFYLLWPAAVRSFSRRALPWICGCFIAGSAALRALYYWRHCDYGAPYTWLVLDGLAWGALLAICARGKLSARNGMLRFGLACTISSALLVLVLVPAGIMSSGSFVGGVFRISLINSFFAGIVAIALAVGTGPWKTILARPTLRFFGEISYGLYLIHMLAFDIVDRFLGRWGLDVSWTSGTAALILGRFVAGATLSVSIAYLSRWYFEEPFLRLKEKFAAEAAPAESSLPFSSETSAAS